MSQAGTGPMDQFVDWDQAAAPIGGCADFQLGALGNVYEENAGFSDLPPCLGWGNAGFPLSPPLDSAVPDPDPVDEVFFETPEAACTHCAAGGFSCRVIRQGGGGHVDGCTSCVALQFQCSLVGAAPAGAAVLDAQPDASFPSNLWPAIDEYPDTVPSCQSQFAYPPGMLAESDSLPTETTGGVLLPGSSSSVAAPPKIGARFSRESVRVLKNWLSAHPKHPYPSEEEKDALQRQTGLSKTQISNWLANARRRGKVQPPRSVSPGLRDWSSSSSSSLGAMEIPQRRATPALEAMNPLQRWQVSPPEHEPASVSAIARAVTASSVFGSSSGLDSPYSFNYTDDSSGRSICRESTASSVGTSRSSNVSLGSAYSHTSRNSWGSFGSMPFNSHGRRRRRRKAATRPEDGTNSAAPLKTFQCTFCTETFRTKHDWQRHEKSLHLSLERWVCAPGGPRAVNPETGLVSCVFCGGANPDDAHIDSHNHSACLERTKEERTFYRKDHLNQHLRLVHNVKFLDWAMKSWKIATPEIRSRCGFCGIIMDSWTIRVDHLAEHFKTGYSMADWKGGWGFEVPVLDMVENSIPPSMRPPAHPVDQNSTPSSWQ